MKHTKIFIALFIVGLLALTSCQTNPSGEARRVPAASSVDSVDDSLSLPIPETKPVIDTSRVFINSIQLSSQGSPTSVFQHEATYRIQGQGFGVKNPVEPILFDTLANQAAYVELVHGDVIPTGSSYNWLSMCLTGVCNPILFWTLDTRVPGRPVYNWDNHGYFRFFRLPLEDKIYMNYWLRSMESLNTSSVGHSLFSIVPTSGPPMNSRLSLYTNHLRSFRDSNHDGEPEMIGFDSNLEWPDSPAEWKNIEFYFDGTQNLSFGFGRTITHIDGVSRFEFDDIYAEYYPLNRIVSFGAHNPYEESYSNTFSMDQVYIDSTQARIVICDVPLWSQRAHSNCEIQAPQNVWNSSTIEFTANQGSFFHTQDAYVYVVNSDGVVNNRGFGITWRGTPTPFDIQFSCSDSDEGVDLLTPGCVVGYENGEFYEQCDECTSQGLREWYCQGDVAVSNVFTCLYPDNSSAPCLNASCAGISCSDSDGGIVLDVFGQTSGYQGQEQYVTPDRCVRAGPHPFRTIYEQFCQEHLPDTHATTCDVFCWQGECVPEVVPPSVACTDSDGGIDFYVKGTVQGIRLSHQYPDGELVTLTDSCPGINNFIDEYYCGEFGYVERTSTLCDNCFDGRCFDNAPGEFFWTTCENRYEETCEEICASQGKVCDNKCEITGVQGFFGSWQFPHWSNCRDENPSNAVPGDCHSYDTVDSSRSRCCCALP